LKNGKCEACESNSYPDPESNYLICKERLFKTVQAIQVDVKIDMTMDSFFEKGGEDALAQNLTAQYGVASENIVITSVTAGSVIVLYNIIESEDFPIGNLQQMHDTALESNTLDFGAPVLALSAS
jgi:hypothetical protein